MGLYFGHFMLISDIFKEFVGTLLNPTIWLIPKFKPLRYWTIGTRVRIGRSGGGGGSRLLRFAELTCVASLLAVGRRPFPRFARRSQSSIPALTELDGASEGNRTPVASLGSWYSTIELRPRFDAISVLQI